MGQGETAGSSACEWRMLMYKLERRASNDTTAFSLWVEACVCMCVCLCVCVCVVCVCVTTCPLLRPALWATLWQALPWTCATSKGADRDVWPLNSVCAFTQSAPVTWTHTHTHTHTRLCVYPICPGHLNTHTYTHTHTRLCVYTICPGHIRK